MVFQREGEGGGREGEGGGKEEGGEGGERDINKQKCKKQAIFETLRQSSELIGPRFAFLYKGAPF